MITNNYIYDNADRGIQLYPDAQGSTIAQQRDRRQRRGDHLLRRQRPGLEQQRRRRNVISNSRVRYNVESWWPNGNPVGTGNLASDNCLWNGTQGNVADQVGFTASSNVVANPGYADRTGGRLRALVLEPLRRIRPGWEHAAPRRLRPPRPPPCPASTAPPNGVRHDPRRLPADASAGSWSGTAPLTFTYTWQRCDAAGANCATTDVTGSGYSLTNADAGATLRVVVQAQNAAGTAAATSARPRSCRRRRAGRQPGRRPFGPARGSFTCCGASCLRLGRR